MCVGELLQLATEQGVGAGVETAVRSTKQSSKGVKTPAPLSSFGTMFTAADFPPSLFGDGGGGGIFSKDSRKLPRMGRLPWPKQADLLCE